MRKKRIRGGKGYALKAYKSEKGICIELRKRVERY